MTVWERNGVPRGQGGFRDGLWLLRYASPTVRGRAMRVKRLLPPRRRTRQALCREAAIPYRTANENGLCRFKIAPAVLKADRYYVARAKNPDSPHSFKRGFSPPALPCFPTQYDNPVILCHWISCADCCRFSHTDTDIAPPPRGIREPERSIAAKATTT